MQEGDYYFGSGYTLMFYLGPANTGWTGEPIICSSNAALPGFVDSSTHTVVVGVANPSSQLLLPSGAVNSSPFPTFTVGKADPITYQVQTFFSGNPSYSANSYEDTAYPAVPSDTPYVQYIAVSEPVGMAVLESANDVTVAGIPLSQLESQGVGVSFNVGSTIYDNQTVYPMSSTPNDSILISLPSSALSYIASHGYRPASASSGEGSVPLDGDHTLSVTFKVYLTASQSAPRAPESAINYDCEYEGQMYNASTAPSYVSSPSVYTNGPADDSLPSSLGINSPSSETGLWFKSLNADGTPASGSKFMVQ
ncbi:MAG: hypothetical protein IIY98_01690, partial [Aeriscardovia sp.]|nr:hypothetical protein [Aeriscardovia sp.]